METKNMSESRVQYLNEPRDERTNSLENSRPYFTRLNEELERDRLAALDGIAQRNIVRQQFEQAVKEPQNKNLEFESIVGDACHDLRCLIVNIRCFTDEISKDVEALKSIMAGISLSDDAAKRIATILNKYIAEELNLIQKSAASIDRMLKGFSMSANAALAELDLCKLDMNEILATVVKNFEFKIREAQVNLIVGPLPSCTADEKQTMRIFSILLDNAIKYRDVSCIAKIEVSGFIQQDQCVYCVEDNGRGMPSNNLEKIFDLFYRINPASEKGEGFGLHIVKRIVERQNGKIYVESEEGKGSRFL